MAKDLLADGVSTIIAEVPVVDADIDVVTLESVDSTNSWCLRRCEAGRALPFICFAQEQTSARGRRGKQWVMTARSDIAMSVAWPFTVSYQQLHLLPLSVAMAIAETLESFGMQHVQIKWPNDVYVRGKKIAGILIETQPVKSEPEEENRVAVVIGVGMNYDMSVLGKPLQDKITQQTLVLTDISSEAESQLLEMLPERAEVASVLLKNTVALCQDFQHVAKQNLEKFSTRYDYCKEKNVEVILDNKDVLSGLAQGINDSAELLVLIDGQQQVFNSAEVSVKV
jgi:BirA family biotin operon repressor/biotin-[acetyl-CoA-carboxylase] ligase